MLTVRNLEKKYEGFTLHCSFEVKKGSITALVGQNGSGKTTTFKAILDLVTADGGEIHLLGKNIKDITGKDKERMGVVLADAGFSEYLAIQDILPILRSFYPKFDEKQFVSRCAECKLPLKKKIGDFSTGMRAKLHVLIALSHQAEFLLLDEPTSGLDVIAREEVLEMLREYMEQNENASILISSHISSDLESLCDEIYMIHEGAIVFHSDIGELLDYYAVIKMDEETFQSIDTQYLIRKKKESYGYKCLTNQKQYYVENYPSLVVEKNNIDELITMIVKGEAI